MTGYCDDCGNQDCVCGEMLRAPTTGLAAALTEECLRLKARADAAEAEIERLTKVLDLVEAGIGDWRLGANTNGRDEAGYVWLRAGAGYLQSVQEAIRAALKAYRGAKPMKGPTPVGTCSACEEAEARANAAEAEVKRWRASFAGHVYVKNEDYAQLRAEVERLTRERDEADESYQYTHRDLIETQDRKLEVEEVRDRYQRERDEYKAAMIRSREGYNEIHTALAWECSQHSEARRLLVALREAWTEYGHCQERWGGCDPATRCTNCALEADIRAFLDREAGK